MKKLITIAILLLVSMSVYSETLKDFHRFKNDESMSGVFGLYLKGLGEGFNFSNAIIAQRGGRPFVCVPDQTLLSGRDYVSIFEKELKVRSYSEDELVSIIMLSALMANYVR